VGIGVIEHKAIMEYKCVMDTKEIYRYSLSRVWNNRLPKLTFIMLNPSIADHLKSDPTLNKCLNFAIENNYGSLEIVNLFAYRSNDPKNLRTALDPIGPDNDYYIKQAIEDAGSVVLAWGGDNGRYLGRDKQVLKLISDHSLKVMCFEDYSSKKKPMHPLTLKNGFILTSFFEENRDNVNPDNRREQITSKWRHLNHMELNLYGKELITNKLTQLGMSIREHNKDLIAVGPYGVEKRIQVRCIRSSTKYVMLPKSRFDANDVDLILLLIIFHEAIQPEFYWIPSSAFKEPNDLFKDRDHYEVPEYGMNVSAKNLSLLDKYKLDSTVDELMIKK
jgi:hypothetical protein